MHLVAQADAAFKKLRDAYESLVRVASAFPAAHHKNDDMGGRQDDETRQGRCRNCGHRRPTFFGARPLCHECHAYERSCRQQQYYGGSYGGYNSGSFYGGYN